jgi:hypothetical protein
MRLSDYQSMGGHMDAVRSLEEVLSSDRARAERWREGNPWPLTICARRIETDRDDSAAN